MTIISEKYNYIFLHIPKNAGSSVRNTLQQHNHISYPAWHMQIDEIQNLGISNFNKKFKFCFVRNPWDRLYSCYNFLCKKKLNKNEHFPQERYRKLGFKNWLLDEEFFIPNDIPPTAAMIPIQKKPQEAWMNINGINCVDFIGRFENLNEDFKYISNKIFNKTLILPKINSKKHEDDYKKLYDNEMIEFVYLNHETDIVKYNYKF